MSKFLLNLLLQISKALVNSKIRFQFRNFFFFLIFGPADLAARLAQPTHRLRRPRRPKSPGRPIQPARRSRLHGKYVFLFGSRLPEPAASPSSLCQPAPIYQMCLPHRTSRPQPLSFVPSGHPVPPDLRPRDARQDNYPAP
jgi:hypothetical protein